MRGWSSLSPCHYPSPTIVVTIQQPSGSRNPIPPSLLGSQLYNSRRPALSCSEYKSAKWKSFQQPADFWWRSKLKALNFIVPCWCSVYDKLFIQKPKLFCYLWSVVKNPVWMRISTIAPNNGINALLIAILLSLASYYHCSSDSLSETQMSLCFVFIFFFA